MISTVKKIQLILSSTKWSQVELADHLKVTQPTVSRWLNDGTEPSGKTRDEIERLYRSNAAKLRLKPDSFDENTLDLPFHDDQMTYGSETGFRGAPEGTSPQIDITAGMGAGGFSIVNEGIPGKHGMTFSAESVKDYWRLPPAILVTLGLGAKDIAIFPVQGDSMQPTLDEGEVVFVDLRHRVPSPDGIYAIIDDFGGLAVKRLEVANDPDNGETVVSVISDNPRHKTRFKRPDDLFIVGRVLRKFGNLK